MTTLHLFVKVLLLPPAGPLLLGLIGLACWSRLPRVGLALCTVSIAGMWLLATPLVADALSRAGERYPALSLDSVSQPQPQARLRAQAIVVLGEGFHAQAPEVGRDVPSTSADLACLEAARLARLTHLPVLVSGTRQETDAMRAFLAADLLRPPHWVEQRSADTHENAQFTAQLLKPEGIERIILVTSSAHMRRSVDEFRAAGFEVTAAPSGMWTHDDWGVMAFVPSLAALSRSHDALYEWCGRLAQSLRQRSSSVTAPVAKGAEQ